MDDAVATAIKTAFTGSTLSTALSGQLARSEAKQAWKPPYCVFQGLSSVPVKACNRSEGGQDDVSMRFNFYTANGPDGDKLVEICRVWADGLRLTLSDGTKIRLSRGQVFYAAKGEEGENPDNAPYRASIDFQYFRQY